MFKYYLVPMALTICVTITTFSAADFVSFAATLILSDIALLFTLTASTKITREEKALSLNLVMLVLYTIFVLMTQPEADMVGNKTLALTQSGIQGIKLTIQVAMVVLNLVLFVYDKLSSHALKNRYLTAIKTSNFEVLGEI